MKKNEDWFKHWTLPKSVLYVRAYNFTLFKYGYECAFGGCYSYYNKIGICVTQK
jgi:hypothetical protein